MQLSVKKAIRRITLSLPIHHTNTSANPLSKSKKTRAVRQSVVLSGRAGVAALVEELQVASVDRESLIGGSPDEVAVADVVGPSSAAVGFSGERSGLVAGLDGPLAVERVGGERAEVAAVGALGLDNHEVLVLALDGVDLHGLEELLGGVFHDGLEGAAEGARELADGHAGAVDLAVVAAEEQVHVLGVADDGLVDGAGVGLDLALEQRLGGGPGRGVGWIARGAVREGSRAPLVSEDPSVLGLEVEEGGGDGGLCHGGLGDGAHLREGAERAKGHGAVVGAIGVGGVDEVLAVDGGGGEVLERSPAALWLGEDVAGSPRVGGGQSARLPGDVRESSGVGHCQQCGAGQQHFLGLLGSHGGGRKVVALKRGLGVVKEWNDTGQREPSSGHGIAVISIQAFSCCLNSPLGVRSRLILRNNGGVVPGQNFVLAVSYSWSFGHVRFMHRGSCVIPERVTIVLSGEWAQISSSRCKITRSRGSQNTMF